jgi:hypothetical protein
MADLTPTAGMLRIPVQGAMLHTPNQHARTVQETTAARYVIAAETILLHLLQGAAHLQGAAPSAAQAAAAVAALAAAGPEAAVAVAHAVAEAAVEDN